MPKLESCCLISIVALLESSTIKTRRSVGKVKSIFLNTKCYV
ncbi:hypothetical protein V12B01_12665 [Vibrio splendidus 12B01]|nr:hypothetical protein V12B01_12665 [Vibrio splendidus 12B01]